MYISIVKLVKSYTEKEVKMGRYVNGVYQIGIGKGGVWKELLLMVGVCKYFPPVKEERWHLVVVLYISFLP